MSIKKKFATAVATASLLAGIFGSAFVPAVLAVTPKASYTEVYVGDGIMPYSLETTIGFQSADNYQDESVDEYAYVDLALFSDSFKLTEGDDAGEGGEVGVRYGDTAYDPARLVATSSNSGVLLTWAVDEDGLLDDCDDLENTLSPRGAVVSGNFGVSDTIYEPLGLEDELGVDVSIERLAYDSEGDLMYADLDDDGVTSEDVLGEDDADDQTFGFRLCLTAAESTTAATSTVTVKADGVTVATLTVKAVGPADSIALAITDGYKYVAGDNDEVTDWLTVTVKDANGTQINGDSDSVSDEDVSGIDYDGDGDTEGLTEYADNPESPDENEINFFSDSDTTDNDLFSLDSGVCSTEEDDDMTGKSYSLKIQDDGGEIVSNAITITCTEDGDSARVTKITPEALSGGKEYEETGALDDGDLSLIATVVAGNGTPLGDGSDVTCDDFDWDDIVYATEDLDETIAGTDDVLGGECEMGYLEPGAGTELPRFGKFTYTLTALNPDLGEVDEDEVDFVLTYTATGTVDTVTIAKVRNAAKTVATITFDGGEGAAYESVYFQVEKANGAVVEYRRRANGDGIARLVLSRRNTVIYVYAFSETSDESDTIKVRFR